MKERPILFSVSMVRALLDGSKRQTRRVVRGSVAWPQAADRATVLTTRGTALAVVGNTTHAPEIRCPYGMPGDRLWVRETFCKIIGQSGGWIETDYQATYTHGFRLGDSLGLKKRWTPSIHMPRDASRITLEITSVRVERLQDISEADAMAEGATPIPDPCDHVRLACADIGCSGPQPYRVGFRSLWQDINGPGSWNTNPWVWVIDFGRVGA